MAPLDRTEKFQIRLTADEKRMLEAVADEDGLSASDLIRQFIRQRFAAVFPAFHAVEDSVRKMKTLAQTPRAPQIEFDSLKKGEALGKKLKELTRSKTKSKKK